MFISGLYAINVEFESQPVLGAIDSNNGFEGIYEKDFFGDIYYEIHNWNELANDRRILQTISKAYLENTITLNILDSPKNKFNNNDGLLESRILFEWHYNIEVVCNSRLVFTFEDVVFQPFFDTKKGISGKDLKKIITKNNFAFFNTCFEKIAALANAYADVLAVMNQNRNLCEDNLPQIAAVPSIDFRICADIDVDSRFDIEQVQADIFFKIEEYLAPSIPFYTFSEAIAKGKSVEEILEGPKLAHGFIFEEEMGEDSFLNFTINLSDIVNAIYETDGLINCRNVELTLTDENGHKIKNGNSWVIKVPSGFKPLLNKRKSKLIFYKNELPLTANFRESIVKLSFLTNNNTKVSNSEVPFPSLNGTYRDLALHYPIANEFPATYKIGKNFPDNFVDRTDFFPSKQLEGYLLLFEQIIANFLTDLHQLKNTLSWKPVSHLSFTSTNNDWRRNYLLSKDVDSGWQNIVENTSSFLRKRNESLDYMLSRFAENLQELDTFFYLATDNLAINQEEYYTYLIDLKQRFLSNYISLSANRGAAIDLYKSNSYFTTPVSGYEDRLSHLLGCVLTENGQRKRVASVKPNDKNERGYFHVLEHILLRLPAISNDIFIQMKVNGISAELLSICTDEDCTACGGYDPYSFTASIVLPAWINVYADVHYRDFIEKLIRKETPVGVMLRICWITEASMGDYEDKIEAWWQARFTLYQSDLDAYDDNLIELIRKQNDLIIALKSHRSEYFPATLHGCDDEGEENNTRIFLDRTFLGKPQKKIEP